MIGLTILVVAIGGVMSSMVKGASLDRSNRETARAHLAARGVIEQLWTVDFPEVFATFNLEPVDDPDGPGTAPGANFAVEGLDPRLDDPDGLAGRIEFPSVAGQPAGFLIENIVDSFFGMPRDLNSDGVIDGVDHADHYTLLPVRVVVEWQGSDGAEHFVELETLLSRR